MGDFEARAKNHIASVFWAYLSLVRFQKFKNWLTADDLLYHSMIYMTHFGVLGV